MAAAETIPADHSAREIARPVATSEETFKEVAEFKADALIARTYTAGYIMQHCPNLKIAGIAEFAPDPYRYAVRKDEVLATSGTNCESRIIDGDLPDVLAA